VTSNNHLDFGDDPYADTDPGIFRRNFYRCSIGTFIQNLLTDQEVV